MQNLTAGIPWSGEFLVKGKDGREFPAQVTDIPIFDEEGNLTGIIGISSDISESKRLEEFLYINRQRNPELHKFLLYAKGIPFISRH